MGFGFFNKDEEENDRPKIEHNYKDRLPHIDWEKLCVDMRVQSVLTGTKGTIVGLSKEWYQVNIDWDNKKESHSEHKYLENVIVI